MGISQQQKERWAGVHQRLDVAAQKIAAEQFGEKASQDHVAAILHRWQLGSLQNFETSIGEDADRIQEERLEKQEGSSASGN